MIVLLPRSGLCFAVARRFYKSTEPGVSVQSQFQGNFPPPDTRYWGYAPESGTGGAGNRIGVLGAAGIVSCGNPE